MHKKLIRIDDNGFILFGEDLIVEKDFNNGELQGYVETPLPTDSEGNQLPFHKPKWNGAAWIEGATQEEIDELTKVVPSPPTEMEILKQRLEGMESALVDLILGGM